MSFSRFASRSAPKRSLLSIPLFLLALAAQASAVTSDSFFDIWVEANKGGSVRFDPLVIDLSSSTSYPTVPTEMVSLSLTPSSAPVVTSDPGNGDFVVDSFFDIVYRIDDGAGNVAIDSFFDIAVEIAFTLTGATNDSRDWDTEILSMDLRSSPPSGGSTTFPALSTTLEHRGHVTVLKIADPGPGGGGGGGSFRVDSFFDIWTEVSVDGGSSYHAADGVSTIAGTTVVPEPTTGLLLGFGLAGMAARRRTRA